MKTLFILLGLLVWVQNPALADESGKYVKAAPKPPRVSIPFNVDDFYTRDLSAAELNQYLKQKQLEQKKVAEALTAQMHQNQENLDSWKGTSGFKEQNAEFQKFLNRKQDTLNQMDAVNLNLMQKIIEKDPKSPYARNKLVVAAKKLEAEQDLKDRTAEEKSARENDRAFKRDRRYLALQEKLSKANASLVLARKAAMDQTANLKRKLQVCQAKSANVDHAVPQSVQSLSDAVQKSNQVFTESLPSEDRPSGEDELLPTRATVTVPNLSVPSVIPMAVPAK